MTIDTSYFEGDLEIAQITSQAVEAAVTLYIQKYEEDLLTKLLGYPLYKLYVAGGDNPEQRFVDLRDGKEYQWNGYTTKWRGLKFTSGTTKRSLIANYVYWHWIKDNNSFTTGSGEKQSASTISVTVSPVLKLTKAWNEMAAMNVELEQFLQSNLSVYPEWVASNYQVDLYSGWAKSRANLFKMINRLGI